jgi:protein-disulfide isomerase
MANITKPPRFLFLFTCLLVLAVSGLIYFNRPQLPPSITINTKGQPTIGYEKARVHVVVFEEPKCSSCREFNNDIFPSLKKSFIDTNLIRFTVVPVAFLPGSMPAANATLCVYYENPLYPNDELFFKYLDYIYRNEGEKHTDWATVTTLLDLAKATSPAINLQNLKEGIEKEIYRVHIERNTAYGAQLMGGMIVTPTVYVNGIKVESLTWENVRKLIIEVLEHEGEL